MLPCSLSFLAGILLILQFPQLPSNWWGLLIAPAITVAWYRPSLLPAVFFLAGIFWVTACADARLQDRLSVNLEGRDLVLQGVVDSIPRSTVHGSRFVFVVESSGKIATTDQVPSRIQLSLYRSALRPAIGERWRFTVRLKRPHGFQNPGGFDYEAYLFQRGIGAKGYVRHGNKLGQADHYLLGRLRNRVADRFRDNLSDNRFAGVVTALAVGSRNDISAEQWEVFRATGTSHLMAISGLHIGMVAAIGFFLFRWLWSLPGTTVLTLPAPFAGAIGAVLFGTLYSAMAGFSVPTQRALVMLVVVMTALVLMRKVMPATLIGSALFAVLAFDPLATLSPGFWLSFLAVSAIAIASRSMSPGTSRVVQLVRIQLLLPLALLPATIMFFQSASLAAPIANVLAVPLFTIAVVPLTLLAALTSELMPAAITSGLLALATSILDALWFCLAWLANVLPQLRVSSSFPAIAIAMTGAAYFLVSPASRARWIGVLGIVPLFYWPFGNRLQSGEVSVAMLDVGQGLAVVVRTRSHTLVYDTGPRFGPQFDTGSAVVAPYLRYSGTTSVDQLVVSHGDNDHIGGAESLIQQIPVRQVSTSVPERLADHEQIVRRCQSNQRWEWDGVQFKMLSPPASSMIHGNNGSCVLHIAGRYGSILLPGDIERKQEAWLVNQYGNELSANLLVAPHHGSRTSSSRDFIEAIRPRLTLFPVGYLNRYRHPDEKVVQRYQATGSDIMVTPSAGAVQVTYTRRGQSVSCWRQENRRFWFHLP